MAMQDIKQSRLSENVLLNGIRVLLNVVFPLVIFKHISRILGPDKLGQVEYVNSIVSYFIFFSLLGMPIYGLREIARYKNDVNERSKIIFELSIIPLILTCISYIVYFFLINLAEPLKREYLLCLVFAPNIFLSVFSFEWFYQGIEEQRYITFRYFIIKILQFGLIILFVRTNNDYIKYALILFGLNGLSSIFNIAYLRKFIIRVPRSTINIKRHLRYIIVLSSSSLVTAVSSQFDVTMLGSLSGIIYVGYYTAGIKAIRLFSNVFLSIFSVIIPRVEYYKRNNDHDKYNEIVNIVIKSIMILLIPISVGIFRFSENIILFLAGDQFQSSVLLLRITSCFLFIDIISFILVSFFMFPNRNEDKYAICIIVAALVSIGLNIVLIPLFAHIGAVVATIISNIVGLTMQLIFSRKYFKVSMFINKETLKYFIAGIIMLVVLYSVPINFNIQIFNIIVGAGIGILVYIPLLILLKSEFVISIFHKLRTLRSRI
jgi:O-antigen/teichoic acid export membrane protein